MKKYFVHFTYRKLLPASQNLGEKLFSFDIVELQPLIPNEINSNLGPSLSKDGLLLALAKKGYEYDVNVLMLSPV